MIFDPANYADALIIGLTFAFWGYLLPTTLTAPGKILGWLPDLIDPYAWWAQPVYTCEVCVAGFQCLFAVTAFTWIGWFDPYLIAPTVVLSMAGAKLFSA